MLNRKATGAMFALLKTMNKLYAGNIKNLIELFDKMVTPIALYNVVHRIQKNNTVLKDR